MQVLQAAKAKLGLWAPALNCTAFVLSFLPSSPSLLVRKVRIRAYLTELI